MDDITTIRQVLSDIFNNNFVSCADSKAFHKVFFEKTLTIPDLKKIHDVVTASSITLAEKTIPSALHISGQDSSAQPFLLLSQIHGNEPAGQAGIAIAMALSSAGMLKRPVIAAIGNPLAAAQYYDAYLHNPSARQQTRDAYRCGLDEHDNLLPDMNRIPVDFNDREPSDHHTKRAQELWTIAQHVWGIADIHSARGNMICYTDHKRDRDLQYSPIRNVLTDLADAISAHASAEVTVKTFKTITESLPNIESQTGIEAGLHEAADTPYNAAAFTLALLHTLELADTSPLQTEDNGIFKRYAVRPRITYADLNYQGVLQGDDYIYMVKKCEALASVPEQSDTVIVKSSTGKLALQSLTEFTTNPAGELCWALYQYDEMEAIEKDTVVAVAVPSGITFSTKTTFSSIFVSKSAALFDKDPTVGPWPVAASDITRIKFCYPCDVSDMTLSFD